MQDDVEIDLRVKNLLFDLMLVLYSYGITEVNVGSLMRILGVSEEKACEHDDEAVELTDEFAKYVKEARETKRPDNTTLH
jgi:serine/threonine protein phosphatase PrpC